jgi:hypothetical protein
MFDSLYVNMFESRLVYVFPSKLVVYSKVFQMPSMYVIVENLVICADIF